LCLNYVITNVQRNITDSLLIALRSDPVEEVLVKSVSEDLVIPLEIQAGFSLPEGTEANRFLLAFGVSTRTSIIISTSTVSLTAICSSTTGFPLCGGAGK
jgi:hypothetical protein